MGWGWVNSQHSSDLVPAGQFSSILLIAPHTNISFSKLLQPPVAVLQNGSTADLFDGLRYIPRSGVDIVTSALTREFMPEEQERMLNTIAEFLHVRRIPGELTELATCCVQP